MVAGAANGLPVVRFDGTDDFLGFTTRLTGIRTVFWVVREDPAATATWRYLLGDSGGYPFCSGPSHQLWSSTYTHPNVLNGLTYVNGSAVNGLATNRPTSLAVVSLVTAGDVPASNFARDPTNTGWWWGDLAELVIYERALPDFERDAVESYLAAKYGLYTPTVAVPSIRPAGGRVSGSQPVTMDGATGGATIHYTTDDTDPTEASPTYTEPLVLTGTTRLRARAFRTGWNPSPSSVVTFFGEDAFTPASVPNLALWVRADAGLGPDRVVSGWADQSARANALVQPSLTSQPLVTLDPTSRLPLLRFDGVDDVLLFTSRLTGIRTVFWVVRRDPSATGYRFLLGDVNNYDFCSGTVPQVWDATYANAAIRAGETRLNGAVINGTSTTLPTALSLISVVTTEPAAPIAADAFSRDRTYGGRSWFGDLGELAIYDRALSAAEVRSVAEYLAARWGLSLAP
jgi:chitobiase/beta-hexosaminidase-like protein